MREEVITQATLIWPRVWGYNSEAMQRAAKRGEPAAGDVSTLLRAWGDGDRNALERMTPLVYEELRRLAKHYMRRERTPGGL